MVFVRFVCSQQEMMTIRGISGASTPWRRRLGVVRRVRKLENLLQKLSFEEFSGPKATNF